MVWPIPARENEIITLSFSPHTLICAWIQKQSKGTARLLLRAYKRYNLDNLELENLIIFNVIHIQNCILDFLKEHKKKNSFVVFSLNGPAVIQKYVLLTSDKPLRADCDLPPSNTLIWDYRMMYNHEGKHLFYLYALPQSLLLQYTLLAIATQLNLIAITPHNAALFSVYKYIQGPAFRRAQFALDMLHHHNRLDYLISIETIRRIIQVPTGFSLQKELVHIATACGLFIAQEHYL